MDKIVTDLKILAQISKETSNEEVLQLDLANRLRNANKTAWIDGCGLAAIQIGVPVRFAWFTFQKKENQLLNPEILKTWGSETFQEGCLSIPNKWIDITRPYTIEYVSGGRKRKKKKANGFLARLIQHEIDHMNGITIIDRGKEDAKKAND